MGLPVDRRADRPTLAEHRRHGQEVVHILNAHTWTRSILDLQPPLRHLQLYVGQQADRPTRSHATAPAAFQAIFGIRRPWRCRPSHDPGAADLSLGGCVRGARRSCRCSTTRRQLEQSRPALPGIRTVVRCLPGPGHTLASWYLGADGPSPTARPGTAPTGSPGTRGAAPNDFTGDTGGRAGGLWTGRRATSGRRTRRHAVAYVTAPLSADTTVVGGGGGADLWSGPRETYVDLQVTIISEVRRTARRPSCRTAGRANERDLRARREEHRA